MVGVVAHEYDVPLAVLYSVIPELKQISLLMTCQPLPYLVAQSVPLLVDEHELFEEDQKQPAPVQEV